MTDDSVFIGVVPFIGSTIAYNKVESNSSGLLDVDCAIGGVIDSSGVIDVGGAIGAGSVSGSVIGKCSSGTGTSPQFLQNIIGIGHPQYLCRETPQTRKKKQTNPTPRTTFWNT